MGLDVTNIFPTAKEGADEFFVSEAEARLTPRTVVKKVLEVVTSSTTLQDDDEIFMSLSAESTYEFELFLYYGLEMYDEGDFKYAIQVPTGSEGKFWYIQDVDGSLSTGWTLLNFATEYNGYNWPSGANVKKLAVIKGWVKTGNTAGNIKLQWAQQDSDSQETRVHIGTFLKVTRQ